MPFERLVVTPDNWQGSDKESPAVRAGDLLFIAAQHSVEGNVREQARVALARVREIVTAAGGTMDEIVDVVAFFLDIRDAEDVLEVSRDFFSKDYPAWTFMERKGSGSGAPWCKSTQWPISARLRSSALRRTVFDGCAGIPFREPAARVSTFLFPGRWRPI